MSEIDYKLKYLKYKNKYLSLKNHFGGTKEEGNNYLLHGTSLFYIDYIKDFGLSGLYIPEIYNKIKKFWPKIKHLSSDPYVYWFIERQERITSFLCRSRI